MNENETLGQRIKRIREEKGMTQEQLGKKAGCDRRTIQNWEKKEGINTTVFEGIAQALDVNSYELATGISEEKPDGDGAAAVIAVADIYESEGKRVKKNIVTKLCVICMISTVLLYIMILTGFYNFFVEHPKDTFAMFVCISVGITIYLTSTILDNRIIKRLTAIGSILVFLLAILTGISIFI